MIQKIINKKMAAERKNLPAAVCRLNVDKITIYNFCDSTTNIIVNGR